MQKDICRELTGMRLDEAVVLDTETTGLDPASDELLQVSVVDARGTALLSSLVRPLEATSWPEAQRVNGIAPKDVACAPTLEELAPRISACLRDRLVVGYNLEFDLGFLAPDLDGPVRALRQFDVMREFARVHGERRSASGGYRWSRLAACASHYGYGEFGAHDALEDALATAYCFRSLLCDEEYLRDRTSADPRFSRRLRCGQDEGTRRHVARLAGDGRLERSGELLPGPAGWTCAIDRCAVGVLTAASAREVRREMGLGPDDEPEWPLPLSVTLRGGDEPTCEATLREPALVRGLIDAAEASRPAPSEYHVATA